MMSANANNVRTNLVEYTVWQDGDTPQQGRIVLAMSAYDARRKRAKELGLAGVTTLMARLRTPREASEL